MKCMTIFNLEMEETSHDLRWQFGATESTSVPIKIQMFEPANRSGSWHSDLCQVCQTPWLNFNTVLNQNFKKEM